MGYEVVYFIDDAHQNDLCADTTARQADPTLEASCENGTFSLNPVRDTQALVVFDKQNGKLVVAVRGTSSIVDVLQDVFLFFWRKDWAGGKVHPGFLRAFESVRPDYVKLNEYLRHLVVPTKKLADAVAHTLKVDRDDVFPFEKTIYLTAAQEIGLYLANTLSKLSPARLAETLQVDLGIVESSIRKTTAHRKTNRHLAEQLRLIESELIGVSLTGHSLGAAVSTIGAEDLRAHDIPVRELYLFASPRVGDSHFAEKYDASPLGQVTYRHVASTDFVANLMPIGLDYKHVATANERHIDRRGKIWVGLDRAAKTKMFWEAVAQGELGIDWTRLMESFSEHRIDSRYVNRLTEIANGELLKRAGNLGDDVDAETVPQWNEQPRDPFRPEDVQQFLIDRLEAVVPTQVSLVF
jgi:hypothetical protein